MLTIAESLMLCDRLAAVSDSPRLDCQLLLSHCLGKNTTYLRTWPDKTLEESVIAQYLGLLARRERGEPIAYLIGKQGFWDIDLAVNDSTLIPRPETELLVEIALAKLSAQASASILDLGSGTGAIALALASAAKNSPERHWQILGCDAESQAVALALQNKQQLGFESINFIQSNWFSAIAPQCFDLIVSNPPYIDPDDVHLQQGDVRFEPRSALVAGNKGLADLESIVMGATTYLKSQGWLMLEHGFDQGDAVRGLLRDAGFTQVETYQDLNGLDRVSVGMKR